MDNTENQISFNGLYIEELRQLCFTAYFGAGINMQQACIDIDGQGKRFFQITCEKLKQQHFLQADGKVIPSCHLDVIDELTKNHKDWLYEFKQLHLTPEHYCSYLFKIADLVRKNDFIGAAKIPKPYMNLGGQSFNLIPYICGRLATDNRYSAFFDGNTISMIHMTLLESLDSGQLTKQIISDLRHLVNVKKNESYKAEMEVIDLYEYLTFGNDIFSSHSSNTIWSLSHKAIVDLYAGNIEQSIELFRQAAMLDREKVVGCFSDPMINYFCTLCIIKYENKYGRISSTDILKERNNHFVSNILMDYRDEPQQIVEAEIIRCIKFQMRYQFSHINKCFITLLIAYFSIKKEELDQYICTNPQIAIITHELAPYCAISSEEKDELVRLYGGKPILYNIRRKPSWEILLDNLVNTEIITSAEPTKTETLYDYSNGRKPSCINDEKPYVQFTLNDDKIEVSTNASADPTGKIKKDTVIAIGCNFTVISLNQAQKNLLERLMSQKIFPISASAKLFKTIKKIRKIIEVKENFISNIEAGSIEGDGLLTVRIEPVANKNEKHYLASIWAMGLLTGTLHLMPASGDDYVFDTDENELTQYVHRNLQKEEQNHQLITEKIKQLDAEFTSKNECHLWSEETLMELLVFCYEHKERYVLEWPKGHTLKFKGDISKSNIQIEIKGGESWLEIEGVVNIDANVLELDKFIEMYTTSGFEEFVRISDDEFVKINEKLRNHLKKLEALKTFSGHKRKMPIYMVGHLASVIENMGIEMNGGYIELRNKMKEAFNMKFLIPTELHASLRPYQEEGYKWISRLDYWGAGACLADDMGLGKTIQVIAFMLSKSERGASLVVVPKSVIINWCNEVARFAPSLKTVVLNDSHDRRKMLKGIGAGYLVICTYGLLTTEADLLTEIDWNVICLDEAHQIKNRNTLASQSAMNLKSLSRIILTGTPILNNVGELWNLMQFINPGILGKWSVFRDTYVNANPDDEHMDMLKEMTQPFILRRTKREVLNDLPNKTESILYVPLSDSELKVYETMRKRVELKFKKRKTSKEKDIAKTIDISYFDELMKLRLASCDMHLLFDKWAEQSSKISSLLEMLEILIAEPDNNILVFSQFTSFLDIVKKEIDKYSWDYCYLDGQTPMKKRQQMVDEFQYGGRRLFLSSLKAGGLGLNLTRANYVIILDPWWNPSIEEQAADRAYRLGQHRPVSVIRLISQNTIEEKILRLHEKKQGISDDILEGTSNSYSLSYDDILDMVTTF